MPSRNIIKSDVAESYYHVYARGASRQPIFLESADYTFFTSLFVRYLSIKQQASPFSIYPHLRGDIELLCYCLMPNHFHLFLYQIEQGSMQTLMRGIMTSYSRYFNHKYKRSGSLFESRYKAALITDDTHFIHISRYIHLNPRYYKRYPYSSYASYIKPKDSPEWLQTERITDMFNSPKDYQMFVEYYEDQKTMLDKIKHDLVG